MGKIHCISPDLIFVESNGAVMEVNPLTGNVQAHGLHSCGQTARYFNIVLRDLHIPKRVVLSERKSNDLDVIPLEMMI